MAIWQVVWKQRLLGQEARNVLHYEGANTSLGLIELTEIADQIRASWVTHVGVANQVNDWQLYGIGLRRVDSAGFPSIDVGFTEGPLLGTSSNEALPSQVAMLIHGSTYTQKPNRVRTYLCGLAEGHSVDGIFTPASVASRVALIEENDELSVGPGTWTRVAVRWAMSNDDPPVSLGYVTDWNEIDEYFGVSVPATQRRRRIGRGV